MNYKLTDMGLTEYPADDESEKRNRPNQTEGHRQLKEKGEFRKK